MTRTCGDCGCEFDGEQWMSRCKPCFIAHKRAEERQQRRDYEEGYGDGYDAGYRDGHRTASWAVAVPPTLIREAISLTHPDRHPPERAALANRVTAGLIELKEAS